MNTISQEFAILPGVMGSCVSDRNKGTFFSSMPDFFTNSMVKEASNNIGRMMQMAAVKGLDPQTMSIRYDKFVIIAMPIDSNAILFILCEPGSNTSLITTTANMLGPEIQKALEQTPDSPVKAAVPEPEEKETDQGLITQQTSQALSSIKDALFDTVGPVADMVYDECIERWTASNPPNISRIFELIGCISVEIDNPDLFEEFKEKISALL
jgi:hypothetical protein